jgi:hypothetical protein
VVRDPAGGPDGTLLVSRVQLYVHEDNQHHLEKYAPFDLELADGHRVRIVVDADTNLRERRRGVPIAQVWTTWPELSQALERRSADRFVALTGELVRAGDRVVVVGSVRDAQVVDGTGGPRTAPATRPEVLQADALGVGPRAARDVDALLRFDDRRFTVAAAALGLAGAAQLGFNLSLRELPGWLVFLFGPSVGLGLLTSAALAAWCAARSPGFHGSTWVLALVSMIAIPMLGWIPVTMLAIPVLTVWFWLASARDAAQLRALQESLAGKRPLLRGSLARYSTDAVTLDLVGHGQVIVPTGNGDPAVAFAGSTEPRERPVRRGDVMAVGQVISGPGGRCVLGEIRGARAVLIAPPGRPVDVRRWLRRRTLTLIALGLISAAAVAFAIAMIA